MQGMIDNYGNDPKSLSSPAEWGANFANVVRKSQLSEGRETVRKIFAQSGNGERREMVFEQAGSCVH